MGCRARLNYPARVPMCYFVVFTFPTRRAGMFIEKNIVKWWCDPRMGSNAALLMVFYKHVMPLASIQSERVLKISYNLLCDIGEVRGCRARLNYGAGIQMCDL